MIEFRQRSLEELVANNFTVEREALDVAQAILSDVEQNGESALLNYAVKFDGLSKGDSLLVAPDELRLALDKIDDSTRLLLERANHRITKFAEAQRQSFQDLKIEIEGGQAGHRWLPLQAAGCYAPGGRYPLPSSVLMTASTARVAGVEQVWVASPNPNDVTLAAAAIAKADGLVRLGGAQAIAAFKFGIPGPLPKCDVIVGPGNRYVTAAKSIVARTTRIDMLAGPSELVVVAFDGAKPEFVAADLLAQAEHDPDARPILIAWNADFANLVVVAMSKQLAVLSTAEIARQALRNGGFVVVENLEEAVHCCRKLAPEHLSLQGGEVECEADQFAGGAALFIGSNTAEVFGDYGAGPNHCLPTGGTARSQNPLSVLNFMRMQTTLKIEDRDRAANLISDAVQFGKLEGLEAHANSSALRQQAAAVATD